MRDLAGLPKAHLHLHFTGSLRLRSLVEMAEARGARLPPSLTDADPLRVPADQRGWFRFQRHYDAARAVVRGEVAIRRVVREAAIDDAAEGSRRLELQVEPSSYAPDVGGLTPALEIILDEARLASRDTGVEVGIVVAASRVRHPLDARTLARLAARHAGDGPGEVVAFGLSNDERRGNTADWSGAFAIAARAGLPAVPHGGELLGPEHVRDVVAHLAPRRLGHGVRISEDPALMEHIASDGIALEVCPTSNVSLGVYPSLGAVPLRRLFDAGLTIALGADDPLLFHARLVAQYEAARAQGFTDQELAVLARYSITASFASESSKRRMRAGVDEWLEAGT